MKSLRQAFVRRLRAWAVRRHGSDALPHVLARRRLYILPTRFGVMLGLMIGAMLVAGLNYASNLALLFAFLMASLAIVVMHHCHRNLLDLAVDAELESDSLAGGAARLRFALHNSSRLERFDLELHCGEAAPAIFALGAQADRTVELMLPTPRRGVCRLTQWEIRTRHPFGWFRAWTYVHAPLSVFVAPEPRGARALPPSGEAGADESAAPARRGDQDFAGLKPYQAGDSLKQMAWKVLARGGEPVVRQYADRPSTPEWLDWRDLPGLADEARLQQLAAWVLAADAAGSRYGLRLPGATIETAGGEAQRRACLRALALHAQSRP